VRLITPLLVLLLDPLVVLADAHRVVGRFDMILRCPRIFSAPTRRDFPDPCGKIVVRSQWG
jgi:hypothetical protein